MVTATDRAVFRAATFKDKAWFTETVFEGQAEFSAATFKHEAWFRGAIFKGGAVFAGETFEDTDYPFSDAILKVEFQPATFERWAVFNEATFKGEASFRGVAFKDTAPFSGTTFESSAQFDWAVFEGGALFDGASFQDHAMFNGASFQDYAPFEQTSFQDKATFQLAKFEGDAAFDRTDFQSDVSFRGASFGQPVELGPLACSGTLLLDGIVFDQPIQLEAAIWRLSCRRTRFRTGGHLRLAWAEINLEDAEIPAPLILSAQEPDAKLAGHVTWLVPAEDASTDFPAPRPSLVSVQRADVAGLVVADIDLRECRFAGAHHLDQLQLPTAGRAFHRAPAQRGHGRQVLAEECEWRQRRGGWRARRWRHTTSELLRSPFLKDARRPHRSELAGLYRQLRKGREDAKNEPGAADFYYGECELRRHAETTPWAERMILWCYWAVSGYGLRGARALGWLAVVVVGLAALLQTVGFHGGDPPFRDAVIYAAQSAVSITSGNRALTDHVSWAGEVLRIAIRLIGPLLIGLALLSVHNRVKR